jgi:hypothetical protein
MTGRALEAVALGVAVLCASAVLSFRPIYEPDLWWHLAQGREDAAGRLVRTNIFSASYAEYRQRYTPWLFDTVAYAAFVTAGGFGIQAVQAISLALVFVLLYVACRIRAPAWTAIVVLAFGFFILEPRAIPRPHLISFAAFAALTLLIERAVARRSSAPLRWAIPLVAVWSNFHVECVFGVLLLAIFAAAELIWPSALTRREAVRAGMIAALCGPATMINPYGWGLIAYLYENLSVPQILAISELQPPPLFAYRAFYVYVAIGAALLLARLRILRLWEALAAVTFATLGLMHLRETPLVFLATAPMVAARLPAIAARGVDPRAIVVTALCAALAVSRIPLGLLFTEFAVGTSAVAPKQFFSQDAIDYINRARLEGAAFNSHNIGGYLAWMLYPRVRVFQDSRLQAYPPEHFRNIIAASASQQDWDALVADVNWAVVSIPRPNQMSGHGRFPSTEWESVFRDAAMEIVVRRGARKPGDEGPPVKN